MKKSLANANLILDTVSENRDALGSINQASIPPTVWVVGYAAINWPYKIETHTSTKPMQGGKIQTGTNIAPTSDTVGIFQSVEAAKEFGKKWVLSQVEQRLDAYDTPLEDEQAKQAAAEYPEDEQGLLRSSSNWAFWIHRQDDTEELGVVVRKRKVFPHGE